MPTRKRPKRAPAAKPKRGPSRMPNVAAGHGAEGFGMEFNVHPSGRHIDPHGEKKTLPRKRKYHPA